MTQSVASTHEQRAVNLRTQSRLAKFSNVGVHSVSFVHCVLHGGTVDLIYINIFKSGR